MCRDQRLSLGSWFSPSACGSGNQTEVEVVRFGGKSSSPPDRLRTISGPSCTRFRYLPSHPKLSPLTGLGNITSHRFKGLSDITPLVPVHIIQYSSSVPVRPSCGQQQTARSRVGKFRSSEHVGCRKCPELVSPQPGS